MGKIVRREFVGSRLFFFLLCISIIFIPIALIYLLEATVTVEEEVEDPTEFLEALRTGRIR
ncbi:hypothetical protein HYR99_38185 [Candidatus Poribacteria bacterium]|nr:hypothetical protein [Candidatus Poribacteria bacterium]